MVVQKKVRKLINTIEIKNFFSLQAEGVRVFILLYKEFQLALSLNSFYSKRTLMTRGGRNNKVNIALNKTG